MPDTHTSSTVDLTKEGADLAREIGEVNASVALDQAPYDYGGDFAEARESYLQNVIDSCSEQGVSRWASEAVLTFLTAFDKGHRPECILCGGDGRAIASDHCERCGWRQPRITVELEHGRGGGSYGHGDNFELAHMNAWKHWRKRFGEDGPMAAAVLGDDASEEHHRRAIVAPPSIAIAALEDQQGAPLGDLKGLVVDMQTTVDDIAGMLNVDVTAGQAINGTLHRTRYHVLSAMRTLRDMDATLAAALLVQGRPSKS